jgi:hypothetical protein
MSLTSELRRACLILLAAGALLGWRSASQQQSPLSPYLVTESPIDIGDGIRLCVAVDTKNQDGVWWWEPGRSGCTSRSTGPGVFHAERAKVSTAAPTGPTTIGFRLGTHSATRPFIDVRLEVADGTMRALESRARVSLRRSQDLDVPELPVRGRQS